MSIEAHKSPLIDLGAPGTAWRFTYYRIQPGDEARVRERIASLHQGLRDRHPGLRAALMRRPPQDGELVTMMEIYGLCMAQAPQAAAAVLDAVEAEAAALLQPWLASARHVEAFEPCA